MYDRNNLVGANTMHNKDLALMNKEILSQLKNTIKTYCDMNFNFKFNPNNPCVRLHEPTLSTEEIFAATETLLSTYTTMGKKVRAFEKQYAAYNGNKYAVMSNSGSSSNLLSVAALSNPVTQDYLKPGDEVLVPALSWSTTVWPIIQCGLIPVFVDCDGQDFNVHVDKLEQALSPRTRAIKLVHVYGNPCEMDSIMAFAKQHNLFVIEDCCEAMGATYKNQLVGTFGKVANFSFFFSHHITTLEGGISVSNDFDFIETMRILRAHGWSREAEEHQKYVNQYPHIDPRFIFINLGYNLRPTEVNAAMGALQLPKLDLYNENRRMAAQYLLKELAKYAEFFDFQQETAQAQSVWFSFPIVLKKTAPFTLKEITQYLQAHKIETRPIIAGNMARHPALNMYQHRVSGELDQADRIMQYGFAFGCHHNVDLEACKYVCARIESFIQKVTQSNYSASKASEVGV
jgi:CDP-6-deoxy-D-xylo-4-hexulose-3-dehydrase